jgi:hypothetical protein
LVGGSGGVGVGDSSRGDVVMASHGD